MQMYNKDSNKKNKSQKKSENNFGFFISIFPNLE